MDESTIKETCQIIGSKWLHNKNDDISQGTVMGVGGAQSPQTIENLNRDENFALRDQRNQRDRNHGEKVVQNNAIGGIFGQSNQTVIVEVANKVTVGKNGVTTVESKKCRTDSNMGRDENTGFSIELSME